jgi:hypothetical protein
VTRRAVAFTYDRFGHLIPEIDEQAAEKLKPVAFRWGSG